MIDRHPHTNAELPDKIERHIDYDDVPEDLLAILAHKCIIRARCPDCGHEDIYIELPRFFREEECKNTDCNTNLLFDG